MYIINKCRQLFFFFGNEVLTFTPEMMPNTVHAIPTSAGILLLFKSSF